VVSAKCLPWRGTITLSRGLLLNYPSKEASCFQSHRLLCLTEKKKLSECHCYYRFSGHFQNWPNTFVLLQQSFSLMLKMLKKPKKPSTTRQNLLAYLTSTCAGVEHKQTSYTMQQKSHLE